jgi:hypothetical protein
MKEPIGICQDEVDAGLAPPSNRFGQGLASTAEASSVYRNEYDLLKDYPQP